MKTLTVNLYSVSELKAQFPDAYARALRNHQNACHDIPWQDETIESLKECVKMAGLSLRDWSLGAYNRGNQIRLADFDGAELTGKRAIAWLENNLLSKVRIPWSGKGRADVRKYGASYQPGLVRPCPLTGYCADEDYLDSLREDIRSGSTVKEAFENLADVCMRLLEQESEHTYTEEYFLDDCEANQAEFTEEGERY